jgi:hypothetical protein
VGLKKEQTPETSSRFVTSDRTNRIQQKRLARTRHEKFKALGDFAQLILFILIDLFQLPDPLLSLPDLQFDLSPLGSFLW